MYSGDDITVLMSIYSATNLDELKMAISSVYDAQTVKPKEIIIVEDGPVAADVSTFLELESLKIPLKIVVMKKNGGLATALREGMGKVTTALIARMDSDDISVGNRFELQLNEFNKDPKLAIVGGSVSEFTESVSDATSIRKLPEDNDGVRSFSKYRSPFNHPTVMMKTADVDKVGGYKDLGKLEDYYLWVRLLNDKNVTVENIPAVLVHMRAGGSMYKRRGGNIKMISDFWQLRRYMFDNKQLTFAQLLVSMAINASSILVPSRVRMIMYSIFLRKKI